MTINRFQSAQLQNKIYNSVPEEKRPMLNGLMAGLAYEQYSPVTRMEDKLGIKGIYQHYKIPQNMDPLDYETLMKPMRLFEVIERVLDKEDKKNKQLSENLSEARAGAFSMIREMHQELITLNPELGDVPVRPNRISSYVAVISGACSGFPQEDIKEFAIANINGTMDELNDRKDKQIQELKDVSGVEKAFDNWCPSEKTFDKIVGRVKDKRANDRFNDYQSFMQDRFYND